VESSGSLWNLLEARGGGPFNILYYTEIDIIHIVKAENRAYHSQKLQATLSNKQPERVQRSHQNVSIIRWTS
jgi:hypothetical protein